MLINMTMLSVRNIHASGFVMLMTPKSTLIESTVGLNYSFNLKQMNTAQRRKNKYTSQRRDNQINHTKMKNKNKQICKN
jgi:hypothetical protein